MMDYRCEMERRIEVLEDELKQKNQEIAELKKKNQLPFDVDVFLKKAVELKEYCMETHLPFPTMKITKYQAMEIDKYFKPKWIGLPSVSIKHTNTLFGLPFEIVD